MQFGEKGRSAVLDPGPWFKDLLVFLVAAGLIVPLFHRARIGAVLGFLLIGVAVGPDGFGQWVETHPWLRYLTIEDRDRVAPFAELGILFLVFLIGIELSIARLWSLRRYVNGIGGLQFVLSAAAIGLVLGWLGYGASAAAVLGLCLAMSSTAVVMQLLEEQGRSATMLGQITMSVLLFQDLMVAAVLFGVEVIGSGRPDVVRGLAAALGQAVIAVVVLAVVGRFVLRPVFRFAAQTGSRELIMAMSLLMVIGLAGATGYAGLSTALGAFLAGLLLSETEYRHQVEIDLAPFKGLLLGLFFVSIGMSIDVRLVWNEIGLIIAAVVALLVIKAIVLFLACRVFGLAWSVAAEVSLLLAQGGEFAFVVIGISRMVGILPAETAHIATAVVGISMVATPLWASFGRWLGGRLEFSEHRVHMPAADATALRDHVVIGGFGRVGQLIARMLEAENVPYVALDTDARLVTEQRRRGRRVYFGDAGRREFLQRAGAAHARLFVVTVNAPRAAELMVAAAHRERPDTPVLARAKDTDHAARLLKRGAIAVVPEAVEASLQLGARLLQCLGLSDEAAMDRLAEMRKQELGRLQQEDGEDALAVSA
jgi:CPA2 family monovalent cation:H+ antiporter-2